MSWKSLFSGGKKPVPAQVEDLPPSPPLVFGKLPTRRDFVRLGGSTSPAFEGWLEEGLEATRARGGVLPDAPLAFSLPSLMNGRGLLGLMVPSGDAAGRVFPLALLRTCGNGSARGMFDWWEGEQDFLSAAQAALADGQQHGEDALVARLDQLAGVAGGANDAAATQREALAVPAGPLLQAMFGPLESKGPIHALVTFCAACDAAQKMGRDGPGITVEAPAPDRAAAGFWLALAGRKLDWESTRPALLCNPERLVLGLSQAAPGPGLLTAYCVGAKAGPRHWTLTTDDNAVRARAALPARAQSVLAQPGSTLADLVEALG